MSDFFPDVTETTRLNIIDVKERLILQREDGKNVELDVVAQSTCGRVILVEVKKTQSKTGISIVEDFQEKVKIYSQQFPKQNFTYFFIIRRIY